MKAERIVRRAWCGARGEEKRGKPAERTPTWRPQEKAYPTRSRGQAAAGGTEPCPFRPPPSNGDQGTVTSTESRWMVGEATLTALTHAVPDDTPWMPP